MKQTNNNKKNIYIIRWHFFLLFSFLLLSRVLSKKQPDTDRWGSRKEREKSPKGPEAISRGWTCPTVCVCVCMQMLDGAACTSKDFFQQYIFVTLHNSGLDILSCENGHEVLAKTTVTHLCPTFACWLTAEDSFFFFCLFFFFSMLRYSSFTSSCHRFDWKLPRFGAWQGRLPCTWADVQKQTKTKINK